MLRLQPSDPSARDGLDPQNIKSSSVLRFSFRPWLINISVLCGPSIKWLLYKIRPGCQMILSQNASMPLML
jgi:hypothetical protein